MVDSVQGKCVISYMHFGETAHRKNAENTVHHRGGSVGSVVANHRGGNGISVTVTTLDKMYTITILSLWDLVFT